MRCVSPWYNRTGWLGVKHQLTYLLTCCDEIFNAIRLQLTGHIFFLTVEGLGIEYNTMRHSRKGRRLLRKPWFEPQCFDPDTSVFHYLAAAPSSRRLLPVSFTSSPTHPLHIVSFTSPPSPPSTSYTSSPPHLLHIISFRLPPAPPPPLLIVSFTSGSPPRLLHIDSTPPPSHRLHSASFTSSPPCLLHNVSTPPPSHRLHPTSFISFPSDRLHPASFTSSPPRSFNPPPSYCLHPASFTSSPPCPIRMLSPWISEFRLQVYMCGLWA